MQSTGSKERIPGRIRRGWGCYAPEIVPVLYACAPGVYRSEFSMCKMFFLVVLLAVLCFVTSEPSEICGVSVVVLGSTGDLAKRYIWPAMFEVFQNPGIDCRVAGLYAAVRKPVYDDNDVLDLITSNVKCSSENGVDCSKKAELFRGLLHVVELESDANYSELATTIDYNNFLNKVKEVGRIFYLAVPPYAYPSIAEKISNHLRPSNDGWIRVILEKPFGHDLHSARTLAMHLMQFLTGDELYLIDHYLGKPGVRDILSFRKMNREVLQGLWNGGKIESIQIALKERVGAKGRSVFYDKYGVICDVMQNHMTELLVHVAMDINDAEYLHAKNDVLSKVYPPYLHSALLGQYSAYVTDLVNDGVIYNVGNGSSTPTFAAVTIFLRDSDWIGVPFLLISGKQLNAKTAYVQVTFKKTHFSPYSSGKECAPRIVFLIQSETILQPGILISTDLTHLSLVPPLETWVEEDMVYEDCPYMFLHPQGKVEASAYVPLLRDIFNGNRQYFVDITSSLLSWEVWSPLLSEVQLKKPALLSYDPTNLEQLAFRVSGTRVVPLLETLALMEINMMLHTVTNSSWIGKQRIAVESGTPSEISSRLAHYLTELAGEAVREKGSFHIALPGGSSPLGLFQSLVLDHSHTMPWRQTHVWQTDERCVGKNDSQSNFLQLSNRLLSLVPVPSVNIHPLPVLLHGGYCVRADKGTELYHSELNNHTCGTMDMVILGMGKDGHVASIFPRSAIEEEYGSGIQIVQLMESYPVQTRKRMTFSLETILTSKKVVLLITGEGKENPYKALRQCVERDLNSVECDLPVVELAQRVQHNQLIIYHSLM